MSIRFNKQKKQFVINTKHTTYAFEVVMDRYLYHTYYGKRTSVLPEPAYQLISFAPYIAGYDESRSPDVLPQECSFYGSGDFRPNALRLSGDGTGVSDFVYHSYRIYKGRTALDGLPAARADEHTQTLEITLKDDVCGCCLKLYYTVFADVDVISRYMVIENVGDGKVKIEKCMPLMLDLGRSDLDMISLYGSHCRELNYQRVPLHHGTQSVYSKRGASSHQYNPFVALCSHTATQEKGEVYGFNFVYSGSFLDEIDVDQRGHTRVLIGLGSDCFSYTLGCGERFCSPEAIMTYSSAGIGKMTQNMHDFIRAHILPPAALAPHPVVLNTWEACYFDIDEQRLVQFAKQAAQTGFDMLVMDDGWFGMRNHNRAGLGDWYENKQKFPDGLASFVAKIKAEGIKFGIWVEPEMVNPDSELYRAHPEWALRVNGREPLRSRHQLVLDMSNPDVLDYLTEQFDRTFQGIEIDYFKWDMNRHMSNVGSSVLEADKQGEIFFRYMRGVYRLFDWFAARFPNAVIETCSGGGGRYDLGMMQQGIQIWTSDNTNPYDRTMIQASALIAYPAATMSCHVSNPHENLRSLDYRYKVAVGGMLGYELNILNMSEEVKREIAAQITQYKSFEHLMRAGNYYCLAAPHAYDYSAYYYAASDGTELLLTVIEKAGNKKTKTKRLKMKAANPAKTYIECQSNAQYSGAELRAGLVIDLACEQDSAHLLHFKAL
ncbi:MAG: alpha-galactosidase [Clostridia bacterium]|nr:alpha-galactosidase [Clostridia bacterium]